MAAFEPLTPRFPEELSDTLFSLKERALMTPNMLSEHIGSQLFQTAALAALTSQPKPYTEAIYEPQKTHTFKLLRKKDGAQILTATAPHATQYQIYFAGNTQDALEPTYIKEVLETAPNKNHVFWDYPGACRHEGIKRFDVLQKAAYKKVKYLLDKGIPAEDITLYGYSMGGGIAACIAKRLHEEGHPVNLTIDRSFSSLSAVVSPLLYHKINTEQKKYAHHLPLGSAIAACAVMGVSIGTSLAGLIASIGTITASLIAGTGYALSALFFLMPGFKLFANLLNQIFNATAQYINASFDIAASAVGGIVALIGFTLGSLIGLFMGGILSLQHLFTDKPFTMPLDLPTYALLKTTTGEMNSAENIQSILNNPKHGEVTIINAKADEVIRPEASLNTGLGFTATRKQTAHQHHAHQSFSSFWYKKANHTATLKDSDIDGSLTFPEASC